MKKFTVEMDTCVGVCEHSDRDWVIDRYGDNEEEEFLKVLRKSGAEYEVIDPEGPGGGWPLIEYTGTLEQLAPVLELLNPYGYTAEEIMERLEFWDGDIDAEEYIETMF